MIDFAWGGGKGSGGRGRQWGAGSLGDGALCDGALCIRHARDAPLHGCAEGSQA